MAIVQYSSRGTDISAAEINCEIQRGSGVTADRGRRCDVNGSVDAEVRGGIIGWGEGVIFVYSGVSIVVRKVCDRKGKGYNTAHQQGSGMS